MVGTNAQTNGHYIRHMLQHNRITLPKRLVTELKLKYTDKLAMHIVNGSIVIKPHIATPLVKKVHKKQTTTTTTTTVPAALDKYTSKRKAAIIANKKHRRSLKQVIGT